MADLPEGAELIPNPINRMPGFSVREHHFLPGFPDMAHPMAEWVLDHHYSRQAPQQQHSVWVQGVTETDLMPLMEALERRFPEHKLFSLPRLDEPRRVELGYRGPSSEIEAPFAALMALLEDGGFAYSLGT